jgi:hypothetical protein
MKSAVKQIVEQVKALPESELDELLSWLAEYGVGHSDARDKKIEMDSREDGPLGRVLKRVKADIASRKTRPLDEVIDNT